MTPTGRYARQWLIRLAVIGLEKLLLIALILVVVASVGKGLLDSRYSISEVIPRFTQVIGAISH